MDIFVGIFMTVVGGFVGVVVIGGILFLYFKNLWKVVLTLQGKTEFTFRTIIRAAGIFFPLLGIAMGFVKGA